MLNWEFAPEYDKYLVEGRDLKRVNEHTLLSYCAYTAGVPLVSDREFLTCTSYKEDTSTGAVQIVMKSVDLETVPPNTSRYVRAEVITSGMIMTPQGSENKVLVECILCVDPKGMFSV